MFWPHLLWALSFTHELHASLLVIHARHSQTDKLACWKISSEHDVLKQRTYRLREIIVLTFPATSARFSRAVRRDLEVRNKRGAMRSVSVWRRVRTESARWRGSDSSTVARTGAISMSSTMDRPCWGTRVAIWETRTITYLIWRRMDRYRWMQVSKKKSRFAKTQWRIIVFFVNCSRAS